jgi:glutamate dehydrogenase (NADP+)
VFKNALTGLPLGGGKGGSDFDPKGKSDNEIRRFCVAFMNELYRYIHPSTDIPAGDIGVGTREIGYLYGQYKRLTNRHGDGGVLTGKSVLIGGSALRPEATGYGLVYMTQIALQHQFRRNLKDVRCAVSGSGNVAQYTAQKLIQLGAKVVTPMA